MLTFLGTLVHAKCEKCESAEQAISSTPIFLNSSARSLNAMISVGHTKVLWRRQGGEKQLVEWSTVSQISKQFRMIICQRESEDRRVCAKFTTGITLDHSVSLLAANQNMQVWPVWTLHSSGSYTTCYVTTEFTEDAHKARESLTQTITLTTLNRPKTVYLQVQRVEEQHHIFAFVVAQLDLFERAVDHRLTFKVRCWLADFWEAGTTHLAVRTGERLELLNESVETERIEDFALISNRSEWRLKIV